jgi:hypothetical protein
MQLELLLFILFLFSELFELFWQKSPTLLSMVEKIYGYYRKSPYLLYLMHPSYILSIYLFYLTQYSPWVLAIIVIKSIDIILKVLLIQKLFITQDLSDEIRAMLTQPLHPFMLTMGIMLYPYLLFMALF